VNAMCACYGVEVVRTVASGVFEIYVFESASAGKAGLGFGFSACLCVCWMDGGVVYYDSRQ